MEPVEHMTLSYDGRVIRSDSERAMELLSKGEVDLTNSERIFLDVWLANFDSVKQKLQLLIDQYMDDPSVVSDLLRLSDRMDATLTTYLRRQQDGEEVEFQVAEAAAVAEERRLAAIADDDASSSVDAAQREAREAEEAQFERWEDFAAFDCPICFDSVSEREGGFRLRCGHAYCRPCAADFVTSAINSAKILDLACPAGSGVCQQEFTYNAVRSLVDAPTFTRYEEFSFLAALAADPNVRWCPRKGCGNAVVNEDPANVKKLVCGKCQQEFCSDCNDEWHIGTCEDYEKWKIENGQVDQEFSKWAKDNTKACPNCKVRIERSSGCMHFTCQACKYEFCWLCMRKYTSNHFDPYNLLGCPGMQFADPDNFTVGKRVGFRILCGAGLAVGAPIAIALAVPVAIIGGGIYGSYKLHKYTKRKMRQRRYGY